MKKLIYGALLFLYVMGTIGGIGYAIYGGSWPIAVGIAVLGVMAFPTAKDFWEKLNE